MLNENAHVFYIKLGTSEESNITEKCINEDLLWLSFYEANEETIKQALKKESNNPNHNSSEYNKEEWKKDWEPVRNAYDRNDTTKTNNALALRRFYTAKEEDYFFTFYKGKMYYCQPRGEVIPIVEENNQKLFPLGTRYRKTSGWKDSAIDLKNTTLYERLISGRLTKTKIFRGTLCEITGKDKETFFNTLNWDFPEYRKLEEYRQKSKEIIIDAMKELNAHDFEVFVDLLLTKTGWNRVGEMGGTVKAIDMEYLIPLTTKHVYVQVKSVLKPSDYEEALHKLAEVLPLKEENICYFAFHTDKLNNNQWKDKYTNIKLKRLDDRELASLCTYHQDVIEWLLLRTCGISKEE